MTAVIAFVGARLSSSRLPGKHLLDLAGKPLIERLFERLERIPSLDRAVLATTDEAVNQPLIDWARATGRACFAWPGDVNDLVGRIDAAVKETAPSVLFYICGDCPLIEPTLIERMIAALKHHPSADFVRVRGEKGKKVIHQGIDAYPISTWRRLVSASTLPHEREHVGAATAKFADQASFIYIEDEPIFFSMEHRLSVDTPSDYRFMSQVYRDWHAEHPDDSIVDLRHVIRRLQTEPQLRAVNAEVKQKGVLEQSLPVLLVTAADDTVGLGHLRRMLPPARALQDGAAAGVQMLIQGRAPNLPQLDLIPHRICDDLARALDFSGDKPPKIIVCDLPPKLVTPNLLQVIAKRPEHCVLAGIDHTLPPESGAQLNWVPSFFGRASPKTRFGWDCYLLEKPIHTKSWSPRPEVVILTGGSDTYRLGRTLPALLHTALPPELTITWIQGPFAPPPDRPAERFQVHHNPPDISALLARAGYALAVYGVSFFECLAHGLPTVVLTPDRPEDDLELTALDDTETALRATTTEQAVTMLAELCRDETAAELLAKTANKLIDGKGPQRLAEALMDLVQEATSRR